MGQRKSQAQGKLWIATKDVARSPGHPFYERLNRILARHGFDAFVEAACRRYYAETMGRPGTPPGVCFRMLLVGYFAGLETVRDEIDSADETEADAVREVVADKGYHGNATVRALDDRGIRTYISPARGRRKWTGKEPEQRAVYANRRRIRGARGRRLLRKRGELLERAFAHYLDTARMRRVHLRGRGNILKRLLVHIGAFNLGLIVRTRFGLGTPRGLQGLRVLAAHIYQSIRALFRPLIGPRRPGMARTGPYRRCALKRLSLAAA